jgi:hypothetical protein
MRFHLLGNGKRVLGIDFQFPIFIPVPSRYVKILRSSDIDPLRDNPARMLHVEKKI